MSPAVNLLRTIPFRCCILGQCGNPAVNLNTLARRWHTTHLASPLRCRRLWLQPGDWTAQTWAACALAPGHGGPCKHIDPLGRLAPIPPDHVEVP
jgi:hypothetical protein